MDTDTLIASDDLVGIRFIARSIADVITKENPPRVGDTLVFSSGDLRRDWIEPYGLPFIVLESPERLERVGRLTLVPGRWATKVVYPDAKNPVPHHQDVEDGEYIRLACGIPLSENENEA